MSEFEFVFSLYSLLLSFSLVALLTGLSRSVVAVVRKDEMKVGLLLPMLGMFVLLDLLSFWFAAWSAREAISVNTETLLAVSLFAGGYFLAANLVFPEKPEDEDDLTDHYFLIRRVVLGILLVLLVSQLVFYSTVPSLSAAFGRVDVIIWTIVLVILMLGAMLFRSKLANAIVLAALIARYVYVYVT